MRALIVEDDPRIARLVERLLAPWKMDVHLAATGEEAFEFLATCAGDLTFAYVDIGLPDVSGLDVVDAIRRRLPTLPIVIATGRGDGFDELGVIVLRKPFVVGQFQAVVDEVVRANRLELLPSHSA